MAASPHRSRDAREPLTTSASALEQMLNLGGSSGRQEGRRREVSSSTGVSVDSITELFGEPLVRRLLQHYSTSIAPMMVWIESEQNEYRRLIIPLSETQPALRLAILAISASHSALATDMDENVVNTICEVAISMIADRVKQLTAQDVGRAAPLDIDVENVEAILAAILVLSNYSLLKSKVSVAQFHRRAARVLLQTLACVSNYSSETFNFLRNQMAGYDILTCTTLFQIEHVQDAVQPDPASVLFGHFLKIIHAITIWPLQLAEQDYHLDLTSRTTLENHFQVAQGQTLLVAGPLINSRPKRFQQDFIQLVAAYHHAGILYAHQRLQASAPDMTVRDHVDRLFQALDHISTTSPFMASIAWPLFIGAICSCENPSQQDKVQDICQILSESTGYKHYDDINRYFTELWESEHKDWKLIACDCEFRGEPIVAI